MSGGSRSSTLCLLRSVGPCCFPFLYAGHFPRSPTSHRCGVECLSPPLSRVGRRSRLCYHTIPFASLQATFIGCGLWPGLPMAGASPRGAVIIRCRSGRRCDLLPRQREHLYYNSGHKDHNRRKDIPAMQCQQDQVEDDTQRQQRTLAQGVTNGGPVQT